jgi:hypothetical protein
MMASIRASAFRARFTVLCETMDAISGETPKECQRATHTVFDALTDAIAASIANGTADPVVNTLRRETQAKLIARCGLCRRRCKKPLT